VLQYTCFSGAVSAIRPTNTITWLYNLPLLPDYNWCSATSSTGTSAILPLTPKAEGGYVVEYAMFGGTTSRDNTLPDPANPANRVDFGERCLRPAAYGAHVCTSQATGLHDAPRAVVLHSPLPCPSRPAAWCQAQIPALAKSFRLRLDTNWPPAGPTGQGTPSPWAWTVEDMPLPRVQVQPRPPQPTSSCETRTCLHETKMAHLPQPAYACPVPISPHVQGVATLLPNGHVLLTSGGQVRAPRPPLPRSRLIHNPAPPPQCPLLAHAALSRAKPRCTLADGLSFPWLILPRSSARAAAA
jgi:hypothetical protein